MKWPFDRVELSKEYPPADVDALMNWRHTNKRRCDLIDKKIGRTITAEEEAELDHLQELAGLVRDSGMPLPEVPGT